MIDMPPRSYRFVQVDVFTDRVFGGNPLAVFLDGRGLDDAVMQQIAREMNLSESVFLFPPSSPDCVAALRIFTPARELPFAGHPTVGTAWVLAAHGMAPPDAARFVLEEKIGPVPVELEGSLSRPAFVWMEHGPATFGPALENRDAVARALGLTEAGLWPGAYLVLTGLVRKSPVVEIVSEQGTKMGRQSFLHIRLAMEGERITGIRVGGSVVPVLDGELRL